MTKQESLFNLGDVFFHTKRNEYFILTDKKFITTVNKGTKSKIKDYKETSIYEWLYNVEFLSEKPHYKRYYESRLTNAEQFIPVDKNSPFVQKLLALYKAEQGVA